MKRRELLRAGALGAAALGASACGGPTGSAAVQTGGRVRWRLASSFPRSLDVLYGAADVLAERVEALSGGAFTIRSHPAGEIVPGLQVMDAVQQGTVQVGQTAGYYYTGKNPALAFETCVPFGMNARQQTAWLEEGGGLELINALYADFGIVSFPAGNTGTQMGGWFKAPISGPGDLQGLKMRIPGLGGSVMNALGVAVQVIAGGEIYPALERGAIDATEWVGPYDDEKLGFHKVAKHYYYPGWWEPGPSLSFLVNRAAWDKLPVTYQEIFRAAARESALLMGARYDARNPAALDRLRKSGIQLHRFSDALLEVAREASTQVLEDHAAEDPSYRKVYDAWKAARASMFSWFGTAELSYAQFAFE